jgi:carnosine N-methyltransferase
MEIEELDSYEEPTNREDDEAERENFLLVLSAYKNYKKDWNYKINKRLNYIETLPENHRALLTEDYTKSLEKIKQYVSENNHVIKSMIKNADLLFNNHSERDRIQEKELEEISKQVDTEKVTIVLKQIVRDWSAGGLEERESCYEPIIETLMEYFNPDDR